jgi:hypothetical protein
MTDNTDFLPENPTFDFVKSNEERQFLISAYRSISECELWDWLKTYQFNSTDESIICFELNRLRDSFNKNQINYNHLGLSYGMTTRQMQYISKNGYSNYRTEYIRNSNS